MTFSTNPFNESLRRAFAAAALLWLIQTDVAFGQPYVFTQAAAPVTTTNATLNGMVTPRGLPTTAWIEWGTDDNYGQLTGSVDVGNGNGVTQVGIPVEGLLADSTYRCRVVASNSAGITYGWESRFTTGRRVASWGDIVGRPFGSFLPPGNLSNVVHLAAGDYHGLALKADGTVVAWGRHASTSIPGNPMSVPPDLTNVKALAGGRGHSLAITVDGQVLVWGYNSLGQTNVPNGLSNVVAIAAGDEHSLALRSNGTLSAWGAFSYPFIQYSPPGMSNIFVAISCGDRHNLALRNNGTVVGWGDTPQATVPSGLNNIVAIAAGFRHSLALRSNGTVAAWGMGSGTNVLAGLSNVVQIAAGDFHGLALKADGTVVAWGTAATFGPITGVTTPIGLANVVSLACGDEFSMALAANTPPQAIARTLTGPVNQDTVLSLAASTRDPNGDQLTGRILSPPTVGNLFQFDAGGRGTAITEPNTPINDASGRVIFAPAPDEFGAPYADFSVVANDGELDSAPGTVTLNILPYPTLAVADMVRASNLVALSFSGLPNAAYSVWSSTDLINWSRLGSASQPSPGQFLYTYTLVANQSQRFFRVRTP